MSDQSAYKQVKATEVHCTDCGKPYSHHPATVDATVFDTPDEARAYINRTSLWAAGVKRVICGACLTHYTMHKSAHLRDIREQLRNE